MHKSTELLEARAVKLHGQGLTNEVVSLRLCISEGRVGQLLRAFKDRNADAPAIPNLPRQRMMVGRVG
jgi:transposase